LLIVVPFPFSRGKRRPTRYYQSPETDEKETIGHNAIGGFDAEMPSEWESWLRHRRLDPPTVDQVQTSLAFAEMKKLNAANLERERIVELTSEVSRHLWNA
jgi:NADH:ubiquinone oxidoreductase subunit